MVDQYDPDYLAQALDEENQGLRNKNLELASALSASAFQGEDEQNLIQYQLETDRILERVEHFLKGDQIKFSEQGSFFAEPTKNVLCLVMKDPETKLKYYIQEVKIEKKEGIVLKKVCVKIENKDGKSINVYKHDGRRLMEKIRKLKLTSEGYKYVEVLDEEKKPFNEYGVAELMRIISMYVTKETFLSNYQEERINEIMSDLGNAIADFVYCNYEKMGMDTKFKESKYVLIVINVLHTIESCYRRALGGAEQENIRTRAIVTQSQGQGSANLRRPPQKPKWHPMKPGTW